MPAASASGRRLSGRSPPHDGEALVVRLDGAWFLVSDGGTIQACRGADRAEIRGNMVRIKTAAGVVAEMDGTAYAARPGAVK